ncbi:hypothetical protein 2019Mat005_0865 [Vibrio phage ICP1]|nr:hypothetical protein 2015DhaA_0825 [Vibrio phage ICP1]QVW06008.1 hypothetical protein 2018Mat166_0870 [Vibrio phage ICP1]QVW07799.1 hypothetical protein 2019Mat005_0865 [Vibrio phage ICP1]
MNKKEFTIEDVLYMYDTVEKWNIYCGNLTSDKSLIPMYHGLSKAEFYGKGEFLEGYNSGDLVMQLDGLGDLSYTVFEWDMLQLGKMYTPRKINKIPFYILDGWTKDLFKLVKRLDYSINLEYSEYAAADLISLLTCYSDVADIRGVFDAVTASNYSKIPLVSEVVDESHTLDNEVKRIEAQGRYVQVDYKLLDSDDGQRVIFTAMEDLQDGVVFSKPKIIKSRAFKEVCDLSQFIY